ncbi:MAG: DUF190 domain-containing protein [Deltaproteobacteria bacterium]|nr:DUF190 domain-containing protein [Deltaproteobacteria bacterium]MBI3296506.1 DUF190 domain-containing protein [Deltaproteobacteria bacterium]
MERELNGEHTLLRIFIGESDKVGHKSLYWTILEKARELGLAGCTVFRGIAGFGASSIIHQAKPFRFSSDLPVVIEIVDTREHVKNLLDSVKPLLQGALVTEEKVFVHHYKKAER